MSYFLMFVGGSGSGKSFEEKRAASAGWNKLVSHTTRGLRVKDGEIEGIDYYYVTQEVFNSIEMVETTSVHGNSYGLSKKELLSTNGDIVLVAEANGIKQVNEFIENNPELGYTPIVVLLDLDDKTRRENMAKRGDTQENIDKRMANEDIVGDFHRLELKADITITKMGNALDLVMEHIKELETESLPSIQ